MKLVVKTGIFSKDTFPGDYEIKMFGQVLQIMRYHKVVAVYTAAAYTKAMYTQ